MRIPLSTQGPALFVSDIAATPSLPATLTSDNLLKIRRKDRSVPDSVTINVEFHDGTKNDMPGVLYGYDSELAAWIPGRYMLFGDSAACLADVNGLTAGKYTVFLDSSISHIFFRPDYDNLGQTADATKIHYTLTLDEHRENH
jgi:hypothetical protein